MKKLYLKTWCFNTYRILNEIRKEVEKMEGELVEGFPYMLKKEKILIYDRYFLEAERETKANLEKSPKLEEKNISKKLSRISEVADDQTMNVAKKNIEGIIKGILKDSNINFKKIEIFMDRNQDNCILMIRCKIYIPQNEQGSEEKIKKELENKLNIKTQIVLEE